MKAKRLTVVALCVFTLLLTPTAAAQETASFRLPSYELYAPAKIIINFVYTNNVTTNVRTLGTSLYKVTTTPVQMVFEADAFDVYTIDVVIEYSLPVNQTVIVGLYEGGRAVKGIEVDTATSKIAITIKVSVVEEPRYPSAEDIAQSMWNRLHASFGEFMDRQQSIIDEMGRTMAIVGALGVFSFVVCVVALIAVFYLQRRTAELSEWGIRHETEHRRG